MKTINFFLAVLIVSSFCVISAMAGFNDEYLVSDNNELLNKSAVKLARVVYPEEARKNKVQGKVLVRITVNEKGRVAEAQMLEGNPIFKEACEKAALASIFKPRIKDRKKVGFSGVLQYSFSIL